MANDRQRFGRLAIWIKDDHASIAMTGKLSITDEQLEALITEFDQQPGRQTPSGKKEVTLDITLFYADKEGNQPDYTGYLQDEYKPQAQAKPAQRQARRKV